MKQLNVKQLKHIHYATANECILLHMNENRQHSTICASCHVMQHLETESTFLNEYECKKYLIVQLPVYCFGCC